MTGRTLPVRVLALTLFAGVLGTVSGVFLVVLDVGTASVLAGSVSGLLIVAAMLRPEGPAGTGAMLAVAFLYLTGTALAGERPAGWVPVVLGLSLYLAHALLTLAAAVPPGATVEWSVPRRWLRRLVEVTCVALLLGVWLPTLPARQDHTPARVAGYVAVALLVGAVVTLLRRRPPWR